MRVRNAFKSRLEASLSKSTYQLKEASLYSDYQARNAEFAEHLAQEAEAAAAAVAAEAETARIEEELRLSLLRAEYAEHVDNMVPKTVYVLKGANNDKLAEYAKLIRENIHVSEQINVVESFSSQ